ncbi:Phosphoenolpyruvate guanylyltransferase [Frankia sp. AiPs1]|uniref:2-phospho-L-lactate guanylyltransferase n=1 Tax=Frankia sp. AiPa1 TaxID=573492 RepID=UPI00202ADF50|nr:2-phospho-L-lactate guanylyltransferase [Frankia sp. AiPa1]MCL9762552.1 2-phospho-L-lactate guanylyltransferase [Frankia sp. AiPa1]
MSFPRGETPWTVLVPLKNLARAKSRLQRPDRSSLALAMALDTVTAVLANTPELVGAVVVVCSDRAVSEALTRSRAGPADPRLLVLPDRPGAGLNPALRHGETYARLRWPARPLAAMSADLPALRPAELRRALVAAGPPARAVLADAAGSGTVLLTTMPGVPLAPLFGAHSHAAHRRSGAVDLTGSLGAAVPGLRRDVDTTADLDQALRLGVGAHTAAALRPTGKPRAWAAGGRAADPSAAAVPTPPPGSGRTSS